MQLLWFAMACHCPVAHGVHIRSAVVEPGFVVEMDEPALQLLQPVQLLAGFMSLSQVPLGQAVPGLVAPGQYQPAGQAAHVAFVVDVGGAVWCEPAVHKRTSVHALELTASE
jgi:hypothetical protein